MPTKRLRAEAERRAGLGRSAGRGELRREPGQLGAVDDLPAASSASAVSRPASAHRRTVSSLTPSSSAACSDPVRRHSRTLTADAEPCHHGHSACAEHPGSAPPRPGLVDARQRPPPRVADEMRSFLADTPPLQEPALPPAVDGQHRHGRRRAADRGRGPGPDLRAHRLLGVRRPHRCLRPGPAGRLRAVGRRARRRDGPAHPADLHHGRPDRHQRGVLAPGAGGFGNVWLLLSLFSVQQAFFAVNQPTRSAILPKLLPPRAAAGRQLAEHDRDAGRGDRRSAGRRRADPGLRLLLALPDRHDHAVRRRCGAVLLLPPLPVEGSHRGAGLRGASTASATCAATRCC